MKGKRMLGLTCPVLQLLTITARIKAVIVLCSALKQYTTNCYLENRSEHNYIPRFLKHAIETALRMISLKEQERRENWNFLVTQPCHTPQTLDKLVSSGCQYDPPNQPPCIVLEEAYKYSLQETTQKKNFCRVNYESYREIGLPLHPAPRNPQLPSSPLSNLGLNSFTQIWLSPSRNLALAFLIPQLLTPRLSSDCGRAAGLTVAGGGRQPYLSTSCIRTATFKPRQAKQMLEESE